MIGPDPKGPFRGPPERDRLVGVYPAIVTDVADPDARPAVKVSLPFLAEDDERDAQVWARLSTLMAGADRGSWFIPEVDDEVLVAFVGGDPRRPIVIGALWNGRDASPEQMDGGGENNLRSITSRAGHKLTFDDTAGAEKFEITTAGGHKVLLDDGGRELLIEHSGGATIKIEASGTISITALNEVKVEAPSGMSVTAARVSVDAGISTFSGVVKADTVITNAVVSSSYTPGAGNVW